MNQDPGLSPHQQPALPLIQMREDHSELRRQYLPGIQRQPIRHTTSPGADQEPAGYLSTGPNPKLIL
jgi:hypothetical protein